MNVKLYKATLAGLEWHVATYPQAEAPDIVPTLVSELVDIDAIIDLDLQPPALGLDIDRIRDDLCDSGFSFISPAWSPKAA